VTEDTTEGAATTRLPVLLSPGGRSSHVISNFSIRPRNQPSRYAVFRIGVGSEAITLDRVCATSGATVNWEKIAISQTTGSMHYERTPRLEKVEAGCRRSVGKSVADDGVAAEHRCRLPPRGRHDHRLRHARSAQRLGGAALSPSSSPRRQPYVNASLMGRTES
jgi:hypothetical protein